VIGQAPLKRQHARSYGLVMKTIHQTLVALLIAAALAAPAAAQDTEVPYWASLRVDEVNMRVGPGEDYRILWVYRRKQLPVKVVRLKEGWRLVQDPDGAQGWMMGSFLTRKRGAIVRGPGLAEMRDKAESGARLMWRLQPGVTGILGDCDSGWCEFNVDGHQGYAPQNRLWGAGKP
jgi:SH3-like domain-containing protein